ncbi:phosphoglycerate mutase family protein [Salegentibacter sp. F188]|uniref:Phosphoglycerate mutase family protein n=1 Tax=Autumnicola patrickiae TaxID=3075591 RepID=A0ABU3DXM4_9FLAO|nr:phosphoglycerate mutase family protein [Salegentibacter sp. F188]MDT0688457.1 phosphoglycerate mutase family protein [Salegentibacter sp. F188]
MKYLLLISIFFFASCAGIKNDEAITTYYFIRHAEKDTSDPKNEDPVLTETGEMRAEKWADTFREIDFDLIYSSNYKRTVNTATPIAESQDKEIRFFNTQKLNDQDFQKDTKGKTVLVVGHSNLNPEWINYILEEEKYPDIKEDEYGSLYIVTIHPNGSRTSQVLYIN